MDKKDRKPAQSINATNQLLECLKKIGMKEVSPNIYSFPTKTKA